jgi:hypothetical protein
MSAYHLTEAYGDLHNPRLTDSSYYDNLRFVDNLKSDEIQEVMEALIWEFMDYGDTFEDAIEILESAFSDDDLLCESLEMISEARIDMAARREQRQRQAAADAKLTKGKADRAARARRAERASAVRGALRGAAESVKGALKGFRKKVRDSRSNLAAKGANMALRGQAALSKVARVARGAVKGAVSGARQEMQPRVSGKQKTQQMRAAARREMGDVFAGKGPSSSKPSRPKPQEGRAIHGGSWPAPPPPLKRKSSASTGTSRRSRPERELIVSTRERMKGKALPPSGKSGGSTKAGKVLTGSQRSMKNAAMSRRLNSDVDYELLAQYMIEDIISEGYATTEEDAIYILENMNPETLDELMESYFIED